MAGQEYDVVVVGGGLAGVAAACRAADLGAATLLLEQAPMLGGNATGAFVHTLCGLYHDDDGAPVPTNPGFATAFAEGLEAAGGADRPERVGRVWVRPTRPPVIADFARSLCAERGGLELRLGAQLVGAELASDGARLRVASADGEAEIAASLVIDTSGAGALGALGGAEHDHADAGSCQLPSLIVRLAGVAPGDVAGYGRLRLAVAVAGAVKEDALPRGCESVLLRPAGAPGEAYLTLNVPRDEVTRAGGPQDAGMEPAVLAVARDHVERIVAHLRATRAGYDDCRVVAWPRRLGLREGARLLGRATVETEALLGGRRRDDEVALSSWPVELWHDHRGARFRYPEAPCGVPLGALTSRSHARLGMAGRCLSASHEALGALRVLGTALATGEAIGLAAGLAAGRGATLADVSAEEVRSAREALR